MSTTTRDALAEGIRCVHAEAQGVLRVWFIRRDDAARLAIASLFGDEWATGLLRATMTCAAQVMKMRRKKPSLCLVCPRAVRSLEGVLFCLAVPEIDNPEQALGSVVCARCASNPELSGRAVEAYRRIWPDIRGIEVMPGPEGVQ